MVCNSSVLSFNYKTKVMTNFVKYFSVLVVLLACNNLQAQNTKPVASKTFQKFTPPKLTTKLGIRSDSAVVAKEEAIQLVALPLKITDDKKNNYSISSYQLIYKRRAVTEDEETGKVSPVISNVSELFKATPLPALWKNILKEQLKPGEELFFFDIIVKDAQGRIMYAPTLHIKVK